MKRRLSLIFFVTLLAFSFIGCGKKKSDEKPPVTSATQLNNPEYSVGVGTGDSSMFAVEKYLPNAHIQRYSSQVDGYLSVQQGKIDAYAYDRTSMEYALTSGSLENVMLLDDSIGEKIEICIGLSRNPKINGLEQKANDFLHEMKTNGIADDMYNRWIRQGNLQIPNIDIPESADELVVGTVGTITPYSFYIGDKLTGYDIELASRFAAYLKRKVEFKIYDFSGIIAAAESGEIDCIFANLNKTPEREEKIIFSEPIYTSSTALMVRKPADAAGGNAASAGFFASVKSSFEKTFIRESRWKLIVYGVKTTIFISIMSLIFGTILGFVICILRLAKNPFTYGVTTVYIRILQGTPLVVLLMILFYIVFAKSNMSGDWVSIVAFSLNFGAYVSEMMRTGIESVDKGQTEAALALGYTKAQAFFQIVMPQAANHFLPVYKGECISLVKITSIVGYIAVQDLTKMSDIIRSRTYEAFFPLIATAIIYFIISWILTSLLQFIQAKIEPNRKNRKVKL